MLIASATPWPTNSLVSLPKRKTAVSDLWMTDSCSKPLQHHHWHFYWDIYIGSTFFTATAILSLSSASVGEWEECVTKYCSLCSLYLQFCVGLQQWHVASVRRLFIELSSVELYIVAVLVQWVRASVEFALASVQWHLKTWIAQGFIVRRNRKTLDNNLTNLVYPQHILSIGRRWAAGLSADFIKEIKKELVWS